MKGNNMEKIENNLGQQMWFKALALHLPEEVYYQVKDELLKWVKDNFVPLDAEVSNDFCGLTAIERKELEVIWNKLTNYGKQKMTYDKYLDAGLEIMTMAYLTGKNKSKNSR